MNEKTADKEHYNGADYQLNNTKAVHAPVCIEIRHGTHTQIGSDSNHGKGYQYSGKTAGSLHQHGREFDLSSKEDNRDKGRNQCRIKKEAEAELLPFLFALHLDYAPGVDKKEKRNNADGSHKSSTGAKQCGHNRYAHKAGVAEAGHELE